MRVELGRSEFPLSWGSGGSWGASSTSNAVLHACKVLREKLLGFCPREIRAAVEIVARNYLQGLEVEGELTGMGFPGIANEPNYNAYSIHSYGAHFAEVGVDVDTAEIRLRRMLGVFAAGRFLNPKTARSQLIGGMTWG